MNPVAWPDHSGEEAGGSGSPNRLLLDFDGPLSSLKSPPGLPDNRWWRGCLADIAILRAEPQLFGSVASDPVMSGWSSAWPPMPGH